MTFSDLEWFAWAVLSALSNGVRAFLGSKVVRDRLDTNLSQVLMPVVMIMVSGTIVFFERRALADNFELMVVAASIQGLLFFFSNLCRIEALEAGLPAHVVFPLIQTSTPIIVVVSAVLFDEWRRLARPPSIGGVILSIVASYTLVRWRFESLRTAGFALGLVAMISSVGATLAAKFAFLSDGQASVFGFILISNTVMLLLITVRAAIAIQPNYAKGTTSRALAWSGMMGLLNFVGFASFLQAIRVGDLSLVSSIGSLSALVPILLASWLHGEDLSVRKHVALFISLLALVLLAQA